MAALSLLSDLCFVDERDSDFEAAREARGLYGKRGVAGAFNAVLGPDCPYIAEVASVYAEDFHRLGYLEVEPRLDAAAWTSLLEGLQDTYHQSDCRQSDVVAKHGPPDLVVDKRVLCYVSPAGDGGWVYFDFWEAPTATYTPGRGGLAWTWHDEDPLLRSIRIPAETFEGGLILTLWGKFVRWGEGWWLDRPSEVPPPGSDPDILEQLRSIHAADPSESGSSSRRH